jgi:hypothetical protein
MRVTVYNCWWHYNKSYPDWGPLDCLILHYKGAKLPMTKGVVCHVPSASMVRETQPKIVMVALVTRVVVDPDGVYHLFGD